MISPFEGGTRRRHGRGRRLRRRLATLLAVLVPIAGVALAWYLLADNGGAITGHSPAVASSGAAVKKASTPTVPAPAPASPEAVALEGSDAFQLQFKDPPSAGLVFDVNSGRVLWRLNPLKPLPIASITKLMTALVVAEDTKNSDQVLITPDALHYSGSGVGLLPKGRHVSVKALLYGLLLPSGNDAAIALADHVAHTRPRFVAMMNAKAQSLGLKCTHYVSPHGLEPGNRSCAADLATLSRIVLEHQRLASIVRQAHAVVRFPIKGGKLWLNNTNPLLRAGYPGTIGLKTGDTDEAGHCFIAIVKRGSRTLGVVLLHSPNPPKQARELLNKGFRADRA